MAGRETCHVISIRLKFRIGNWHSSIPVPVFVKYELSRPRSESSPEPVRQFSPNPTYNFARSSDLIKRRFSVFFSSAVLVKLNDPVIVLFPSIIMILL